MTHAAYSDELINAIIQDAFGQLPAGRINRITFKEVRSPWEEKIQLQPSKKSTDIVFFIWKGSPFLVARIRRLTLYALDYFNPAFAYDSRNANMLRAVPGGKRTHDHIWSIYVDSRMEKTSFENFYDRTLRRNLFIDSHRTVAWSLSCRFFDVLWEKAEIAHPEIVSFARDPDKAFVQIGTTPECPFEVEINHYAVNSTLKEHVENIVSEGVREAASSLLAFVDSRCRGTVIESSCYGIRFVSHGELMGEMVTTREDTLLVTLFDVHTSMPTSYVVGKNRHDLERIQYGIKETYDAISRVHAKESKEPFGMPI